MSTTCEVYLPDKKTSTLQSILISPTLTILSDQNIIFCFLCGQHFKTLGGLAWHNTIIKKYNQSSKIVQIPKKVLKEFKQSLVFLIHQKLSNNFNHMEHQIFDSNEWGRKFYKQNQQTYVVIQEFNASAVEESEIDVDSLLQLVAKKPQKQYHKPKFTYSEVLVEWRYKKKIEENGTICMTGFIYIYFFINQKRILM
ncbi:45277_t:CDS:2 [Gigaspora margarita]|uniref:45277_t:CDS:1 n=1 Tax=Gigaspora margarita TaxID=4874 RepID=A0ABN7UTX0_GIGMA|nr:45277_t:CDS:2 [Gigaspora margarita]